MVSAMNPSLRPARVRLLVLLALFLTLLLPLAGAPPAHAERLGPGQVAMPGFSGYVTRGGGELGIGRLGNGIVGICLDTGPGLRWPSGTPAYRTVRNPRVGYLAATYLGRARHNGRLAAALWWAVGGTLGLNSHPAHVRDHVAALRAEAPRIYATVRAWHDRMLAAARRDAAGSRGYTTRLRVVRLDATTARLSGLGALSGTGHWVGGHRMRLRLRGARFASGATTWRGSTRTVGRSLLIHTIAGRATHVRETVTGLASDRFRRYDAGGSTQRVAASAPTVEVHARAVLPGARGLPKVPLRVVKTSELDDPAGLLGVTVAVHADTAEGPILDQHTFTAADVHAGQASYTTAATYDPSKRYVVTITAEPAGWLPEATSVTATAGGPGLEAHLVDDRIWQPRVVTQASAKVVRPGVQLHDVVTVGDTGGDDLQGSWRLLGPVNPGATGCQGLDWSGAAVAAEGTFLVAGDGTQSVGAHRVWPLGCYTYVEQVAGNRTTLPVPWTTPGVTPETTLVRSVPRLATTASSGTAIAGETVVDRVSVSGLGEGSTRVEGRWQLLGPIAPNDRHGCGGLDWSHAPTAARGTFTVTRDGLVTVGRHRLRAGGCYTYRERLEASPVSAGAPWDRPGIRAETVLTWPAAPVVPAHPTVPAGGAVPAQVHSVVRGSVSLAATGLRAALHPVAFDGDALTPPGDIRTAGLWRQGASLDSLVGTSVLVGHVSDYHDRPGAFHRLWGARAGQTILTVAADGATTRWRITRVYLTAKRALPAGLFRQGLIRRLVLVTCGDEVHYADGHFHYRSNLVVEAVPR